MLSACHSHESGNLAEQIKCLDSCWSLSSRKREQDDNLVFSFTMITRIKAFIHLWIFVFIVHQMKCKYL